MSIELLTTTPSNPLPGAPTVVLAHGAGAGMRHPFMAAVATGLADRGLTCVRFEFAYMAEKRGRPDPQATLQRRWLEAIDALGGGARLVIGGKSLGGRIASQIADSAGVRGLVCLGYPFHAPGQPATPARIAHLAALQTTTLIVQGTRDPFGTPAEVATYSLSPQVEIRWLEDGDHSLAPRKRSGFTAGGHLETALDAVAELVRRVS
jgi:predicted alpha/beta-hydrolase family hydrolase